VSAPAPRLCACESRDFGGWIQSRTATLDFHIRISKLNLIAATAASTSRILLTTDARAGFDQLTGVRAEVLELP
jgi:predicted nucleic acid-binding protein